MNPEYGSLDPIVARARVIFEVDGSAGKPMPVQPMGELPPGSGSMGDKLRRLDADLRGRDLGSIGTRLERIGANAALGAAATGVDLLDAKRKFTGDKRIAGLTLREDVLNAGLEAATDTAIELGGNALVATLTREEYEYVSPFSALLGRIGLFTRIKDYINPVNVEAALRILYNIPVIGVPVEKLYVLGNTILAKAGKLGKGIQTVALVVVAAELRGANPPPPVAASTS